MSARQPAAAVRLALAATAGGAVVVPLVYLGRLEAPFLVPKTAALEVAAALSLVAFALALVRGGAGAGAGASLAPPPPLPARGVVWAALAVLATTAVSWAAAALSPEGAPYAGAALARWAALFGVACGACVVAGDRGARRTLLTAAAAAGAVVSAIGLIQHFELARLPIPVISAPGSTFGNRNLAGEAVALSLPLGLGALAGAGRRRGEVLALGGALALEAVFVAVTRARGAWLAGAAGVFTVAVLARPRISRAAAVAVAATVLAAGVAALMPARPNLGAAADTKRYASGVEVAGASFDPRSIAVRTRLGLWRRSLALWRAHPVAGVGPGNWPRFFPRVAEPGAARDGVLTATMAPRQAHDDLLERATETGAVGLAALLALIAAAARAARRGLRAAGAGEDRAALAAAAGTLVALLAAGITGFPLEMPATLFAGGLGLGLLAARAAPRDTVAAPTARPRVQRLAGWAVMVLACGLLVGAGARAARDVRGAYWLRAGERALFRDSGAASAREALPALARARALTPGRFLPWLRTAQAELRAGGLVEGEAAARHALVLEPWSPNAWAYLAALQLPRDPAGAQRSAEHALALLPAYPAALVTLARAARANGDERLVEAAGARLRALDDPHALDQQTADTARGLIPSLPPPK